MAKAWLLCREFGISRKTGYKIFERYEQCGLDGLSDCARRPFRYANPLPGPVEAAIVAAKREKPPWGARKIREHLLRCLRHAIKVPASSTIHAVLDRHGLGTRAARTDAEGTPLSDGLHPNDLWCTGYKGEFMLCGKRYCYPLTVTDYASRDLLLCEAMESNWQELAFRAFERLFRERGLPRAIRSHNGVPFALLMDCSAPGDCCRRAGSHQTDGQLQCRIYQTAQPWTIRARAAHRSIDIDVFHQKDEPARLRVFAADAELVVNREWTLEIAGVAGIGGATQNHGSLPSLSDVTSAPPVVASRFRFSISARYSLTSAGMMTLSIQDLSAGSSRFPSPDDRAETDCRSIPLFGVPGLHATLKPFLPRRSVERTWVTKRGKTSTRCPEGHLERSYKAFSICDAVRHEWG